MDRPMVVKDMKEHMLPKFPLWVQPKKDGIRCMVDNVGLSAWLRPRKKKDLVQHKDHIQTMIQCFLGASHPPGHLDGELLVPGRDLNAARSGVKGSKSKYQDQLEYFIFDLMIPDMAFACRYALLEDWHKKLPDQVKAKIRLVPAVIVHTMEELTAQQDLNDDTDEGSVIRDPKGLYSFDKSTRAAVRWKYKQDAEFLCVDIVDGIGKNVGVATFVCETADGQQFNAASTGKLAERKRMYEERDTIIGKMVTITYQTLHESGKPQFGQFKAVRDYEG